MKLYCVSPANPADSVTPSSIQAIAALILPHLSVDPALFGMKHTGEVSGSPLNATDRYGYAEVVRIEDEESLLRLLLACGDPNSGQWMLIRSLVTCRAAFYGHDGQVFVCLPTTVAPIVSPDETRISAEECSHLLTQTDYMDGLLTEADWAHELSRLSQDAGQT